MTGRFGLLKSPPVKKLERDKLKNVDLRKNGVAQIQTNQDRGDLAVRLRSGRRIRRLEGGNNLSIRYSLSISHLGKVWIVSAFGSV
jgi:hypothetical protein